jgi:hypothetical protein
MADFKTVQKNSAGIPYLSDEIQVEYDWKEERVRLLDIYHHPGQMGLGDLVYTNSGPGIWRPVPHGSTTESLLKVAYTKLIELQRLF